MKRSSKEIVTKSIFHDQYEFLRAAEVQQHTLEAEVLASKLILEEFKEFCDEDFYMTTGSVNTIKEVLDLIYVCSQFLNVTIGPDKAKQCWDALQENNMSKCIDGKLVKREDGKVLKPDTYKKLDLTTILN